MPTNHRIQTTSIISTISYISLHYITFVGLGAASQHVCHGSDDPSYSFQLHHSHNTHDTDIDENANKMDFDTELTYCPFPSAHSASPIPISGCPLIDSLTHLVYFQRAASYLSDLSVCLPDLDDDFSQNSGSDSRGSHKSKRSNCDTQARSSDANLQAISPDLDPCKRCLREKFLWQFPSKEQQAWVMKGEYQQVPNIETHTLPASPFPFWISSPHHDSVLLHLPRSLRPTSSFSDLSPTNHKGNHSRSGSDTNTIRHESITNSLPSIASVPVIVVLLFLGFKWLMRSNVDRTDDDGNARQPQGKVKQEQMGEVKSCIAMRTRAQTKKPGRGKASK